ncbi:hypothetical protein V2L09_02325 [Pseudomonas alliivorans]|nr:hypothetical protein [Pseudomonas alliivorans]
MTNKPNDALLPCPFCGQVPIITKHHREEMYSFMHRCEVLGPISRDFREDPAGHVRMWNTRTQPADQQGEPVGRVMSEAELPVGFDRRTGPVIWFGTPEPGLLYRHAQPTTAKVVLQFDFLHPISHELRTLTLNKRQALDGMEDYFYEILAKQICQCESVGETNVVDCNCDDYVHDFEIVTTCLDEVAKLNNIGDKP